MAEAVCYTPSALRRWLPNRWFLLVDLSIIPDRCDWNSTCCNMDWRTISMKQYIYTMIQTHWYARMMLPAIMTKPTMTLPNTCRSVSFFPSRMPSRQRCKDFFQAWQVGSIKSSTLWWTIRYCMECCGLYIYIIHCDLVIRIIVIGLYPFISYYCCIIY